MKQLIKRLVFGVLGKDPEGVVVSFLSGEGAVAMAEEVERLIPDRRHYVVSLGEHTEIPGATLVALEPGSTFQLYRQVRRAFRRLRIGMAAVLLTPEDSPLRRAAFLLAPRKILAYNTRLERHHLQLSTAVASWLFLRGVPLDRIHLRPWWLWPWKKDRSEIPTTHRVLEGRPVSPLRRRAAVLSPYFPYPLSHGGAVRIFHLLREAAREFDVFLFAFSESGGREEVGPLLEFCAKVILVGKPRYREPRWSSLDPPEVCEYRSPIMQELWNRFHSEYRFEIRQVEYTYLAPYGGNILVEHDVTFDLYRQVYERAEKVRWQAEAYPTSTGKSLISRVGYALACRLRTVQRTFSAAWWDWWRWQRFENRMVRRYRRVIAMSQKDSWLLGLAQGTLSLPQVRIVPNGVDLDRFRPEEEKPGQRLLFIGSFRHFPNIVAYRFFTEQVWGRLRAQFPEMTLTVVAGPNPLAYWRAAADSPAPAADTRVRLLEFVRDVRPLYVEANVVIVPTLVSAGTNVKVLEAMAMERAVVSTSCGCAGLGLQHGASVWIADTADEFARGVAALIADPELRRKLARAARLDAETHFDWKKLGELQSEVWRELAPPQVEFRPASDPDLAEIRRIQEASPEGVAWDPQSYLAQDCRVLALGQRVAGFVVARKLAEGEFEILNVAVDPEFRRRGIATFLLREAMERSPGCWFLEVRESNRAARNLYGKFGFQEVGRRTKYYQDNGEDAVVMRRESC